MRDDELQPHEMKALESLRRESDPGRVLEERTVRALAMRGLLRTRRARFVGSPWTWSAAGVAALALFATGFFLGRSTGTESNSTSRRTVRETQRDPGSRDSDRAVAVGAEADDSTQGGSVRYVVWF